MSDKLRNNVLRNLYIFGDDFIYYTICIDDVSVSGQLNIKVNGFDFGINQGFVKTKWIGFFNFGESNEKKTK